MKLPSGTLAAVVGALLAGCATIGTLTEEQTRNKIYSGTIRQVELKCAHATCLDFPFSLIADTVLLPVTIPWTVISYCCREKADATNQEPAAPKKP